MNLKKGLEQRKLDTVGYPTWKMKMHSIPTKNGAITHQLTQSVHDDLQKKTFVSTTNDWERQNYGDIIDRLSRLDRDARQHNQLAVIKSCAGFRVKPITLFIQQKRNLVYVIIAGFIVASDVVASGE